MTRAIPFDLRLGKLHTLALEYNIVEHCNLQCVNCDHASPLMPTRFISEGAFASDLLALSAVLHASELKIIGGEPLLHPNLMDILDCARRSEISDIITVATNGLLLHRMPRHFWERFDRLWLSIYPGVKIPMPFPEIDSACREFKIQLDKFYMTSFRHTLLTAPITDGELVRAVFRACELPKVDFCHTVRNGRYYKCSPSPFAEDRLARLGVSYSGADADGVEIHNNPSLLEDLVAYFSADEPLPACAYCLGSSGRWLPHKQLNQHNAAKLTTLDGSLEELLDREKLFS
jgi:hypothetical protein